MKSKLLITGVIGLVLFTGCGCSKKVEEKEPVNNNPTPEKPEQITNPDMIKDQTIETLEFKNTEIVYDGYKTTITSSVTNNSDEKVTMSTVFAHISYKDTYGRDQMLDMRIYFGQVLEPHETRTTKNTANVDLRNSASIEYEIVR